MTSNFQIMHLLTMRTRNTRPMYLLKLGEIYYYVIQYARQCACIIYNLCSTQILPTYLDSSNIGPNHLVYQTSSKNSTRHQIEILLDVQFFCYQTSSRYLLLLKDAQQVAIFLLLDVQQKISSRRLEEQKIWAIVSSEWSKHHCNW